MNVINTLKRMSNWWMDIDFRAMGATYDNPTDLFAVGVAIATVVILLVSLLKVMFGFYNPWTFVLAGIIALHGWTISGWEFEIKE